jgi:anaerobic ribonucleoside-triphosphate reductase activating protein
MNFIRIDPISTANGLGIRTILWVSGCRCNCPGCHNPETWDFNAGSKSTEQNLNELIQLTNKTYIKGCTISGGHPLDPYNVNEVTYILKEIKKNCFNKDIWIYTGYRVNIDFLFENEWSQYCDVLVDGPFIQELKDLKLKFRGSSNQRIIDVQASLKNKKIFDLSKNI